MAWIVSCGVAGAISRPGNFEVIGPGGGGSFYNPTISPNDPNTVLVSSDMTGEYITHDGGRSWRMFNLRGTASFFAFDPKAPHTIYADTIGLWRSTDNGEKWKLIYPRPSSITGLKTDSDGAGVAILASPDPLGRITAFAVDPDDSNTLYAATEKNGAYALFISRDYGKTWQRKASLPEAERNLWVNPHSTRNSRELVLTGVQFAVIAKGSQIRKIEMPGSPADRHFVYAYARSRYTSAGFTPSGQLILYVVSRTGGSVSRDGGASWQAISHPGTGGQLDAVAASFDHPETAYISFRNISQDGKRWRGVLKTTDTGRTWTFVWKAAAAVHPSSVHDAWITPRFWPVKNGKTGLSMKSHYYAGPLDLRHEGNPDMLAVDDHNANLAYATDAGRAFNTTDGGKNWNALYSRRVPGGEWTTTGLDPTTNYGIFFDPFDHNHQFIAYTDIGLFSSEDGGKSWKSATAHGVPVKWTNTTYWLAFDPKVRGRMWIATSYDHDLPRPKMWKDGSVEEFEGGVCISTDGGRTWTVSNTGMAPTAATDIILDPTSPVNARVLYVTGFGDGVYKSTDGGKTWTLKNEGITQKDPFAWRIERAGDGTLYLLVARESWDGSIGNSGDGAIYKSTDGADSWTPVKLPQGVNGPNGLAIDPRNPQRLYLAAWPRAVGMHGEGGGVYLSTNGGKSWKQIFDRETHVYDVTIDPKNPDTVYAAGYDSSAWISRDRGERWTRISGPNFHWMQRVIPDPDHPGKVYIATFGGSIWHGDLNGKGWTDIATPELQPGR
jgi:photosystem II stability/assembly factor-like uncharacterized protein